MKAIQQTKSANIIVTQPRRVAAISLAKRVCVEIGCPQPGNPLSEVGYNVRLARATSDATKITYCTVGVLLRMLVNPLESYEDDEGDDMPVPLSNVSHVIIDEVHERDLNTDFILTLLRPLLIVNKRISIILMSATASASLFADYFSMSSIGLQPRILDVPGRTYPISTLWLEDIEMMINKKINWKDRDIDLNTNSQGSCDLMSPRTFAKIDYDFIKSIILDIGAQEWNSDRDVQVSSLEKENGSILVFLPGKGEIDALSRILYNDSQLGNHGKCAILKLHSSLSPSQQWRAFQPVTFGILKVVLATNVAETSITIPDVSYVIDTGRAKEVRFNPETRIKDLVTVWISKASSRQRSGRAGRTGPGVSYKLYSERFSDKVMQESTSPEIMRLPLEDLILQVCLLKEQHGNEGVNPIDFLKNAPEPPSKESIEQACSHLIEIRALQSQSKDCFRLTSLGYHLAHLPMDAKVGKILITGCILQCIEPALTIAGILSSQKSCWLDYIPGVENSRDLARKKQTDVIKDGFGGTNWPGGSLKGDLIAQIAVFDAWVSSSKENRKRKLFANSNGLDHEVLRNIEDLRFQFKEALMVSGLLSEYSNTHGDDVLLTSCCLVAGLYPNISTLLRPSRERKIRGGRLITQDGSLCKASSNSFQKDRIRDASENGKDAYAVYHSKHRIIGVANSEPKAKEEPFLSNINFVPRFAVLLFGGNIEVKKNCLILDKWLKFKVDDMESNSDKISEKCQINAILIKELRKEIDQVILKQISKVKMCHKSDLIKFEKECENVIRVIRMLLVQD
jgi:HrpA-like RNA helicase